MTAIPAGCHGLLERDLLFIRQAIEHFPEIAQVILFGSRAKGCFKKGSDVDLALKGGAVSYQTALHLASMLNEELPLPYYFDVLDYGSIHEMCLIEHIDRIGLVIYEKDFMVPVK